MVGGGPQRPQKPSQKHFEKMTWKNIGKNKKSQKMCSQRDSFDPNGGDQNPLDLIGGHSNSKVTPKVAQCSPKDTKMVPQVVQIVSQW